MVLNGLMFFAVSLGGCRSHPVLVQVDNGWTPPAKSTIPAAYIVATKTLLGNGLSDARGGEFHKVSVMLGNAAGMRQASFYEKQGYGWIMPDKQVVLIDGLKYPVKSDLGKAKPEDLYSANPGVIGNFTNDGIEILRPTAAMTSLLLVRGETELAEKFYEVTGKHSVDPVLSLYAELTYRYTMQVGQSLMDRNDQEALKWAKPLALVSDLREKAGVNYGKDTYGWRFDPEDPKRILEDAIRRAEHPKPKIDVASIAKIDQNSRISALIDSLDEVASHQWGQPGGISWMEDPIMTSLAKEGEAAVPALLDCIENDNRLTRSVSYGRDFFPARTIHTVRTAALNCLQTIWPAVATLQYEDPNERVLKLREMWKLDGSLSEPERWLRVLRDDTDTIGDRGIGDNWLLAARHLTDQMNVTRNGQHGMTILPQKSKVMHGEPLRAKFGAEITALLTKRIDSLTKVEESRSSMQLFQFGNGLSVAHCLALWDHRAATPVLQKATANTLSMVKAWQKSYGNGENTIVGSYAKVIADRANAGDQSAAKDFESMLSQVEIDGSATKYALLPLWKCPNNAAIQAVGVKFLADLLAEKSKPTKPGRSIGAYPIDDLLRSAMIISPAFRSFLIDSCSLKMELGEVSVKPSTSKGYVEVIYRSKNGGGSYQFVMKEDVAPYTVQGMPLNLGEWMLQSIGTIKGAPSYLVSWPSERRTAAKLRIAHWLNDRKVNWERVARSSPFSNMDFD